MKSTVRRRTDLSVRAPRAIAAIFALAALAGCAVNPVPATTDEVMTRVKDDVSRMYVGQDPITGPVTFEEAVARALKYNLDYRLKKMESALALGVAEQATYDMLPNLVASAGYRTRNNDSGGTSIGIVDRVVSLRPSTSEQRHHSLASAEFSWNALDFGVSYYRARQQSNQFLIAEERRRKVVQNMIQDVRTAYWRALGAQRLLAETNSIVERARTALGRSREAETQRVISPVQALTYQRALLDAITLLNQRRQDLEYARRELAALMNVEPGVDFVLADMPEAKLPPPPKDVRKLEDTALLQRPELREEDFRKRITADEARKQLLSLFPNLSFDAGAQHDSDNLLYNNSWTQGGLNLSFNLIKLFSLPTVKRNQEQQEKVDQMRRMALSMAVMTQVRISAVRYSLAIEDFRLADEAAQVDKRLADYTRASVTSRLDSELEAIRTQARAVLGAYQRMAAYGAAQVAFAQLYDSVGIDPLADDFEGDSLPALTERVRTLLKSTESETLPLTSNLFGHTPEVSVHVAGVKDPIGLARIEARVKEFLLRNDMEIGDKGTSLTFTLGMDAKDGLEKTSWSITASDPNGKVIGEAVHVATLPNNPRQTALEAALNAAMVSNLRQLRGWAGQAAPK
ncbi:MAG TPA: TolC family protein [Ramlibacter sp.]|nr:TolC family protein [Ramlibacter sp.]